MSLIPTNSPSICMTIENAYRQYARATSPRIDPTETSRDFPLPNNYEGYPSWYPIWPECDMPSCRTGNLCSTTGRKVRPFAEHTIYVRHGQQRRCRCQPGAPSGKTVLSCQALPGSLMSFHGNIGHKGQLGKSLPCPGSMQVRKDTIFLVSLARKCKKCIRRL